MNWYFFLSVYAIIAITISVILGAFILRSLLTGNYQRYIKLDQHMKAAEKELSKRRKDHTSEGDLP